MTKRIEMSSAFIAIVLSVLLVAQYLYYDAKQKARQLNEIELTEQLNVAAQIRMDTEIKLAKAAVERKKFQDDLVKTRVDYAHKCYTNLTCATLAQAVYFEDRGGGVVGMKAVANVIVNRVDSSRFPNSIHAVVTEKRLTKRGWVCQFSYVCQLKDLRMKEPKSKILAGYVAYRAVQGVLVDITNGADHYVNISKLRRLPSWIGRLNQTAKIGAHTFYASNP